MAFDMAQTYVALERTGSATLLASTDRPPPNVDGLLVGAGVMTRNAPHAGERHPDGDELLYLISGHVAVVLEEDDGDEVVEMTAGQGVVVPRGVWHRVVLQEPSHLLFITPGPGGEHRPLADDTTEDTALTELSKMSRAPRPLDS